MDSTMTHNYSILVIDDNPHNIQLVGHILRDEGYRVAYATSAESGRLQLLRQPFSLVLLDYNMPIVSGVEFCRQIKGESRWEQLPVIFLTARTDEESVVTAFESGAVDYITKPIRQRELLSRVATHLQLQLYTHSLQQQVEARVEEIRQLHQQLCIANQNASVGEFVHGMAHDFKNAIHGTLALSRLIEKHLTSGEPCSAAKVANYNQKIQLLLHHKAEVVKRMLHYGRDHSSDRESIDMAALLNEQFALLQVIVEKSVEFQLEVAPDLPYGHFSRVQLQQVVMNLVINARNAMAGRGTIWIRLTRWQGGESRCVICDEAIDGDYLLLEIADSGPGIAEEMRGKIFQPFFSSRFKEGGSGMGLAMVNHIVHEHGGHIELLSSLGDGAQFRLFWPVAVK
ncbi:hybrid sensor histidine kinase/response regulator [Ectothiorhodospiraceae bacterium BW-2]|nr:hybrid sensor histidine kinase/response regulator [Ectothiorhodospiraceae bacterium BW-2]